MNTSSNKVLISDLFDTLATYMSKSKIKNVYKAYLVAANAHDGQYRKSGEEYVHHPISVAMILAELKLDYHCIVAALLHDCIEDTSVTYEEIKNEFGSEIANIVEGVSKLTGLEFHTNVDKQAKNFRKLFLAMSNDMRVMLIKLADRLHNMRTIDFVVRQKQLITAKETMEIHAPIARRLGLNSIRTELDNLCFSIIHPYRSQVLLKRIKKQCGNRTKTVEHIQDELENRLKKEGLSSVKISGRSKAPYSIYKKMRLKQLKFSQVLDMHAFRVIVDNVAQCYQALGIVHNLYKPFPGKFKDYIALPKSNGYQSLHTVLFGPKQVFIEVQIRSTDMHFISEYGIAAHWHYKNSTQDKSKLVNNWLSSLLDIQQNSGTSVDFLEGAKNDLFPSEVFVFTPMGKIIQLPYNSTVIDFAYIVHTDFGNRLVKAKIDQTNVPLTTILKSGQTVEVITDKNAKPNPSWLQIAVTAKARFSIKSYLKKQSPDELAHLGEDLLISALEYQDIGVISKKKWKDCLTELNCVDMFELYTRISLAEILVSTVLNKLQCEDDSCLIQKMLISSTKGRAISFAHCCYPIPGDKVVGVLTSIKGMVIHRSICTNFIHAKKKHAQWLKIDWRMNENEEHKVKIVINVDNQLGVLSSIANSIAKMNINIEHLDIQEKDNSLRLINMVISVADTAQLQVATMQLKQLDFVQEINRL